MRIAIFGTGGVGGYFGGRLAQAGHDVAFIARGAHLAAIQRGGLRVESIAGDFVVEQAEATDDPRSAGPFDVVIVGVKAWQVPQAAAAIAPALRPKGFVVPLSNGVEAADQLAAAVGPARVMGGLCRISAFLAEPGRIRHVGIAPSVEFGERDDRRSERAVALLTAFAGAAGVKASIPNDIEAAVWEKFLFIAPFSGVGAITKLAAGDLRSSPPARALLASAMEEVDRLARARGVRLRPDALQRTQRFVDALPPNTTASMQRDILEGRPSELEAQTGAVVRLGRAAGVSVPVNERIYRTLLPDETRARASSVGTG